MVHPPWNDGGNREIPSSFSPLFDNSIDMMLLYSSHLRRDGASPFLKRHCCFFFLRQGKKRFDKGFYIWYTLIKFIWAVCNRWGFCTRDGCLACAWRSFFIGRKAAVYKGGFKMAEPVAKKSLMDRFLNTVEAAGNKLPDPATLFYPAGGFGACPVSGIRRDGGVCRPSRNTQGH